TAQVRRSPGRLQIIAYARIVHPAPNLRILVFAIERHGFRIDSVDPCAPQGVSAPNESKAADRTRSPDGIRAPNEAGRENRIGTPDEARSPYESGAPHESAARHELETDIAAHGVKNRGRG